MDHTFTSALVLLLLVLDPLGNLPVFISILRGIPVHRRARVALREGCIAFAVLLAFMLGGKTFLQVMNLSERSLEVAGGAILLVIAMRMVFGGAAQIYSQDGEGPQEPLIFPLAIPMLAGPSAMATVLLLASRHPEGMWQWAAALTVAMVVCTAVLLAADRIRRLLGDAVVSAMEKLMGLVLTAIAIEMLLAGVQRYFAGG